MEIRQLKYFLTLAEELHFKKASEKLFIVQPALTKQIQDLEKELGVQLFERNKRKVKLTIAGEFFRNEIIQVLEKLEEAKNKVRLVEEGQKGEIRIGYVGSCIHTFLPDLLTVLNERHPEIQTYLSEMTSASQLQAIQKGELDVAFLRNPPANKRFGEKLIFQETFALVLPEEHHLNQHNFEGMHQVAHEKFILPTRADGEQYYQLQWSICEDAGFLPQIAHETVHGHTVLKLIDHHLGISLLPTSFKDITNASVKFIELPNIPQRAEITALWDRHNPNPSLHFFLELLDEIFFI
ncbi:LysR substrate-binding domain-containing protein [Cytophagaceae bacterium DM2B3-1]|uniref:LysR substrate-binding domain-containing protein n=1 Tax=Xanthocytophaga flava TaxID=3048013 RepID=A0ABT7CSJ7_9BACT|nr:LysR substrate-binding domain-containing protein [Xanthocytophaga flavus]MDJ1471383.1 LysR substrate-binding domain-containing protein [Xanthocytophaga flavus]MDJ1496741.1 LysR substrate-binding domain-containing protein [Xanthocytophaga flavus]